MNPEGLITRKSRYGFAETVGRVEAELSARGVAPLARIDHSAAAGEVGLELDPTILFVFGNPRVGTHLMQAAQSIGVDLPMRLLVWQDRERDVRLGYDDPRWLGRRHGVGEDQEATLAKMEAFLDGLATAAGG